MKVKTERLNHPYVHGLRVKVGNHYCDIVRTHGKAWHVYQHGFHGRTPLEACLKIDMPYLKALALARKWATSTARRAASKKGAK